MVDVREQLNLNRLLVENSLGLMCIHDFDGVLIAVNPAVAESLGYTIGEGIGRNLRDFLAPTVRHLFDGYLQRIRRNPVDSGLMRLLARDGTERTWFYRNIRHEEPGAEPLILGHALDITDRIRAEQALKEAQKALQMAHAELAQRVAERTAELQQSNGRLRAEMERRSQTEEELLRARKLESLAVLAGGIAHDFNNFLTVVQGNVALARMQLDAADPVCELLEQAEAGCQRATSLASQLLTFARGGAPVRQTASVARLVTDAVHLARAGANVTVDLEIAEDLRSAEVDVGQISQVLHNVLLNARQAMPDGGTIQVRAENFASNTGASSLKPGDYVRISIRDQGCGIAPEVLGRVFDPYFTTKEGGSGLGLATAYAIVSKHQGHIQVQSTPGAETTFNIYLPASERSEPAAAPSQQPLRSGKGRILVVDDEDALRKLMSQMLVRLGYEAECAREGGEAVALYEGARASGRAFDAVMVDLTIPGGMGGIEAAAKLRAIDAGVKLIVSSGYSDAPVMSEFRRYGFDAVIPKPWSLTQVSAVFRQVFARESGDTVN